jgi:hypothetical protein
MAQMASMANAGKQLLPALNTNWRCSTTSTYDASSGYFGQKLSHENLRKKTGIMTIHETIKMYRWRWLEHVFRMLPNTITSTALRLTRQGKRNRGRPKEKWRRTIKKELKCKGLTIETTPVQYSRQRQVESFCHHLKRQMAERGLSELVLVE